MLSALFQDKGAKVTKFLSSNSSPNLSRKIRQGILSDRTLTSPQPTRSEKDERNGEQGKNEAEQQQQEVLVVGSEDDRKVAAELENLKTRNKKK